MSPGGGEGLRPPKHDGKGNDGSEKITNTALVACTQSSTGVRIKKLVEEKIILEVGIKIKRIIAVVDCSPAIISTSEKML